jgi:hypothetical protein
MFHAEISAPPPLSAVLTIRIRSRPGSFDSRFTFSSVTFNSFLVNIVEIGHRCQLKSEWESSFRNEGPGCHPRPRPPDSFCTLRPGRPEDILVFRKGVALHCRPGAGLRRYPSLTFCSERRVQLLPAAVPDSILSKFGQDIQVRDLRMLPILKFQVRRPTPP